MILRRDCFKITSLSLIERASYSDRSGATKSRRIDAVSYKESLGAAGTYTRGWEEVDELIGPETVGAKQTSCGSLAGMQPQALMRALRTA